MLKIEDIPGGRKVSSLVRNQDEAIKLDATRLESPAAGLSDEQIDSW